jgi:UDP-glucuronate 4-epimerase
MRVCVTGAAGFIGSSLVDALLARGDVVVAVDNFDPFYPRAVKERNLAAAAAHPRFTLHELDVRERRRLAELLTADTVMVHLAARAGVRPSLDDPAGYADANVGGTAAVAAAACGAGVRRIVFASSSSVYGDDTPLPCREDAPAVSPVSPYGATKRGAELLLESLAPTAGLAVASLRFFTVYGPRQRPDLAIRAFAERITAGEPVTLFGDGGTERDYTFIDDVVEGVLAAIEWTGAAPAGVEHFNIGGGSPVSLARMVEELGAAFGARPSIERAPMQPGDVIRTAADLTKSRKVLGYRPRTSFRDGIAAFAAWHKEEHASTGR